MLDFLFYTSNIISCKDTKYLAKYQIIMSLFLGIKNEDYSERARGLFSWATRTILVGNET